MAGPRNARTDPDSGLRFYTWPDPLIDCLSVTSLRRIIGMPHNLATWQVTQVLDAAIVRIKGGIDLTAYTTDKDWAKLKTEMRSAGMAGRDQAAEMGTLVHEAIDLGLSPSQAVPALSPFLLQYMDAARVLDLKVDVSEAQVWHLNQGWAGSLDAIGKVTTADRKGMVTTKRALIDYKTGKGVYLDHLLQLMTYALAEFVGADGRVDKRATDLLHSVETLGILHIRPDGWEWLEVKDDDALGEAAEHMVGLAIWMLKHPTVDDYIAGRWAGKA